VSTPFSTSQPATIAQSPTMEPTDRSIPPVMMTKVIPMARKAFSATCFDTITALAADRKFGAMTLK